MPGTFVFKPIEANLTHNTEWIGKMDPYCAFIVGNKRINTQVCKKGGKHPHWNDSVSIPITTESKITVELMDKDKITKDDHIGSFMIDLQEIETTGKLSKWYPVYYKNKPAGEILLETLYEGYGGTSGTTGAMGTAGTTGLIGAGSTGMMETEGQYTGSTGLVGTEGEYAEKYTEKELGYGTEHIVAESELLAAEKRTSEERRAFEAQGSHVFMEQRQKVEPHTFMKDVDVVETRPVLKEIEVLEPHKVLKDVQYTEAVHVKKQIETMEPKVVTKEVEVVEPRLVTKQIQVIENVPVTKQVDVIESVPVVQEIDTVEPQTFSKKVEVTEQVPVMKQVTVTEPVHMKKAVEFVEPIITTQTITKEMQPAVVVDEKVTTEVGPASLIGLETKKRISEEYGAQYADTQWSQQERLSQEKYQKTSGGYGSQEYSQKKKTDVYEETYNQ